MKGYSSARLLLFAAAALVAELTALSGVGFRGTRPDLLVPVACFAALFAGSPRQALGTAWAVGLIRDAATVGPPGLYSLLYLGLAVAITHLKSFLFRDHPATQLAVSALGAALVGLATALAATISAGGIPWTAWILQTGSAALLTAVAGPILMGVLIHVKVLVR